MVFEFPVSTFMPQTLQVASKVIRLQASWMSHPNIRGNDRWLFNTATKVALLRNGSRYNKDTNVTTGYKIGRDNTIQDTSYYLAHTTIANMVREFFRVRVNQKYHLIIDVCTVKHQCALYVVYRGKGDYEFYAFDPNRSCSSQCFVTVAKLISGSTTHINVWSSFSDNYEGRCVALTWRFLHSIIVEGYRPVEKEAIVRAYNISRRKTEEPERQPGKKSMSTVGYVRENGRLIVISRAK